MNIKSSHTLVAEALREIKTISPEQALKLSNENKCNLIDIREKGELDKTGRVENSHHIPRGMLEFWLDPESPYFKNGKVIGITLKLYNDSKETASSKQCCAGQDIMDAKRVADKLKIEHKILYYQNKFKEGVIDNFIDSYLNGETPIPCVQCNKTVKFTDLFEEAKRLNADALVTGHYVKSITEKDNTDMYRGIDLNRDQSYFLFNTTKDQLNFLRFPLGNLLKDETRNIARELDLNVADKPDSQDICFVPNGDYASVIEKFRPNSFSKGNIKNMNGEVIGVHDGIINYTIGQRKGIGVSDKNPLYVVKIIADKNEIIVGAKEHLVKTKINLKDLNIITNDQNDFKNELFVKVRSTGRLIKAKIDINDTNANVNLLEEEHGIAPGQACVFYAKNNNGYKVLGGGWIKS